MDTTFLQNPWVAGILVAALAAVLLYALSRRSGRLGVKVGPFSADVDKNSPGADREVAVARGLEVRGEAGNITGVRGAAGAAGDRRVDVAGGARVTGKVGDITGIDASADPER